MGNSGLQKIKSPGADDDLRMTLHLQLATEVVDVLLDRVHTQHEAMSDLMVGGTSADPCGQQ